MKITIEVFAVVDARSSVANFVELLNQILQAMKVAGVDANLTADLEGLQWTSVVRSSNRPLSLPLPDSFHDDRHLWSTKR